MALKTILKLYEISKILLTLLISDSDFFFPSKCNAKLMTAHWWYPVYFLCRGEEMLVYRKKLNVILSNLLLKMSTTI